MPRMLLCGDDDDVDSGTMAAIDSGTSREVDEASVVGAVVAAPVFVGLDLLARAEAATSTACSVASDVMGVSASVTTGGFVSLPMDSGAGGIVPDASGAELAVRIAGASVTIDAAVFVSGLDVAMIPGSCAPTSMLDKHVVIAIRAVTSKGHGMKRNMSMALLVAAGNVGAKHSTKLQGKTNSVMPGVSTA